MGSVTHPRGRLPRRVYWVRRGLVVAVALLLVFGIGKLLGGNGADDPGAGTTATNTSAERVSQASPTIGPVAPSTKIRSSAKVPLLPPDGDCLDDDVSVLPSVPRAWAAKPIVIKLQLLATQPACTFKVSPETLVVKITSGNDRIWSSQDCPESIPTTQVVVRSGAPVEVPVTWSGRRSDDQCSDAPGWAYPGFYHVYAAALGSTPTDVQFEVTHAAPNVVTRTPRPHRDASAGATTRPSTTASQQASQRASSPAAKPTSGPTSGPTSRASKKH